MRFFLKYYIFIFICFLNYGMNATPPLFAPTHIQLFKSSLATKLCEE